MTFEINKLNINTEQSRPTHINLKQSSIFIIFEAKTSTNFILFIKNFSHGAFTMSIYKMYLQF